MKKIELLAMGCELLKMISENGIKVDDYKYIELFKEYYDVECGSEEAAYLQGYLMRGIISVIKEGES